MITLRELLYAAEGKDDILDSPLEMVFENGHGEYTTLFAVQAVIQGQSTYNPRITIRTDEHKRSRGSKVVVIYTGRPFPDGHSFDGCEMAS